MDKPGKADLLAAVDKMVPDVIASGLRVLFCGINPGLYSAATGHHFARPGNRFWPALYAAGFTQRLFSPAEERNLLEVGLGITNIVPRATTGAAELSAQELALGAQHLATKVLHYRPKFLAVLGIGAYRGAFDRADATLGRQLDAIGSTTVWVLPNPSGLNAHYQRDDLARLFLELRHAAEESG